MHKIEYKLKFMLDSLTLKIVDISDISDAKKVVEFNNIYCGCKKIHGFCNKISESTKFPLFNVPLEPKSRIHKVVFCQIAVGNSLFVSNEYAENLKVPNGYDSLIVDDSSNSVGYLSDIVPDVKKYSYVIKDVKRILPLYEVTFEYDEEFERRSRGKSLCHRCMDKEAIVFCPCERANFCDSCDQKVHDDDFLKRHERKYFDKVKQKKFIVCNYHPTKTVEYFCEECLEPLCTECKITGNHSSGKFSSHSIKPFLDACKFVSESIYNGNPSINEHIKDTETEIVSLKDKVSTFKLNVSTIQKQLEKEFRNLQLQLETIENNQRQVINAELLERIRKFETLTRMISYPSILDPADLLYEYKNILEQRKTEEFGEFEKFEIEKPEIYGKITLKSPKASESKGYTSKSEDNSVKWRIETMNINGRSDNLF